MEHKTISVQRWRSPDGAPTCCADHPAGQTCRFLGVRNFGTVDVCMLGEQRDLAPRTNDFQRPDARCEVWAERTTMETPKPTRSLATSAMNHDNRGRLTVTLGDGWRLYSNTIPAGSRALGVVSRAPGQAGALIVTAVGVYAQCNAGALQSLPQAKVLAAIEAARNGR